MRKSNTLRTAVDTAYMFPMVDIQDCLNRSSANVTYNSTNIICNTFNDWSLFIYQLWELTTIKIPDPDPNILGGGYTLGDGTLLEDMNKELFFLLPSGSILGRFRLVRQLTPQSSLPSPGLSPNGTIGYLPTFIAKYTGGFDPVRLIRV
jgi:hypothetical protein